MNKLSVESHENNRDREYLEIFKSMSNGSIEEVMLTLEKEISRYLEETLPPRTDFNVSISITRREDSFDLSVDVLIRGSIRLRGEYDTIARDAINYAKKKFIELLKKERST